MSETHYCADCHAPVLLRDAEGHAEACPSALKAKLAAAEEYLNDICDAYERWKNLVEHGPGHGISDPTYPGPSDDEIEAHEDEVGGAWHDLEDFIEVACGAREGE